MVGWWPSVLRFICIPTIHTTGAAGGLGGGGQDGGGGEEEAPRAQGHQLPLPHPARGGAAAGGPAGAVEGRRGGAHGHVWVEHPLAEAGACVCFKGGVCGVRTSGGSWCGVRGCLPNRTRITNATRATNQTARAALGGGAAHAAGAAGHRRLRCVGRIANNNTTVHPSTHTHIHIDRPPPPTITHTIQTPNRRGPRAALRAGAPRHHPGLPPGGS